MSGRTYDDETTHSVHLYDELASNYAHRHFGWVTVGFTFIDALIRDVFAHNEQCAMMR
jgi:hypothetical protein